MYYDIKESGLRIKSLRRAKGLTQEQLADKLNISTSNLSKIEIGYSGMSIDLLIELALFFEVSLDYIILGREIQMKAVRKQVHSLIEQMQELEKQL
ncbi:MAG: helix-turn-helix transcriptional regulator [Lachnospiraceae bacterium]|nr:helix-turn-helix transcriptional regulator [Lachnospiraceae bacterium]